MAAGKNSRARRVHCKTVCLVLYIQPRFASVLLFYSNHAEPRIPVYRMFVCFAREFTRHTHECDARSFVKDVVFLYCFAFSRNGGHSRSRPSRDGFEFGVKNVSPRPTYRHSEPRCSQLPRNTLYICYAVTVAHGRRRLLLLKTCARVCAYTRGIAYLAYAPQCVCVVLYCTRAKSQRAAYTYIFLRAPFATDGDYKTIVYLLAVRSRHYADVQQRT